MVAKRKDIQLEVVRHNSQPGLPNHPESPQVLRRLVENKPKRSFYTLKMLLTVCGIGIFGLMFIQLYMDSQINHIHYDIQRVRGDINHQLTINEQLNAQISELSQYARIIEIAYERGLTLSENIINVNIER